MQVPTPEAAVGRSVGQAAIDHPGGGFMVAALAELTERDLRGAMSVLGALAEHSEDRRSFVTEALDQLTGIVASELTTLSICDLRAAQRHVVGRAGEALSDGDRAAFNQHFRDHPLVRFHGAHPGGPTQRITDCITGGAFRNSALHADYYRRIGINYVMALPLRIDDDHVVSVVFNRSHREFTDAERAVLDAIRLPLAALYRKLLACEAACIGLRCVGDLATGNGWHLVRVSKTGRILDASAAALDLLRRHFPREPAGRGLRLPTPLAEWYFRGRSWGLDRSAMRHVEQFTASRSGMKLTAHCFADPLDVSAGYFLLKGERSGVCADELRELPLTEREREILALVTIGKTNGEIGVILAISGRTVQKHLEHVFQKLGVETRTAAAMRALAAAENCAASAA
jgi:DNA-binding CsgD family transcriptional regulator